MWLVTLSRTGPDEFAFDSISERHMSEWDHVADAATSESSMPHHASTAIRFSPSGCVERGTIGVNDHLRESRA